MSFQTNLNDMTRWIEAADTRRLPASFLRLAADVDRDELHEWLMGMLAAQTQRLHTWSGVVAVERVVGYFLETARKRALNDSCFVMPLRLPYSPVSDGLFTLAVDHFAYAQSRAEFMEEWLSGVSSCYLRLVESIAYRRLEQADPPVVLAESIRWGNLDLAFWRPEFGNLDDYHIESAEHSEYHAEIMLQWSEAHSFFGRATAVSTTEQHVIDSIVEQWERVDCEPLYPQGGEI